MKIKEEEKIAAVVLAAGKSSRMKKPKLLLPWGESSVIRSIVSTLVLAKIEPIIIVTGAYQDLIQNELAGLNLLFVHNPNYEKGEMLSSLQVAIKTMPVQITALMIVLGDQPFLNIEICEKLCKEYQKFGSGMVIPSFQMRRGHPWIVDMKYLPEIMNLDNSQLTLKDFIDKHTGDIHYLNVNNDDVLKDMDTVEEYNRDKPVK
jgi:molybdenum cofactor cytidylyltransferase